MSRIGDFIRERRLALKLSMPELARKVDLVHREQIYSIEQGRQGIATGRLLLFSRALEVDVEVLVRLQTQDLKEPKRKSPRNVRGKRSK